MSDASVYQRRLPGRPPGSPIGASHPAKEVTVERAIWSGSISFGLINVPVKLYSAVSRKTVRFHQLHDADGVPIRQKRVCPEDRKEVPYEHIVKGYEIAKGQYVVVTPEELEAIDPKKTRTIDIQDFV